MGGGDAAPLEEEGPSLRFYGFSDFSVTKFIVPDDSAWASIFNRNLNFYLGNLNLYMDADLTHDFRSLFEVRFMFLPSGADDPNAPGVVDPSVNPRYSQVKDYTRADRLVDWGAIRIERAYLEYTMHSLLRLRVGRFLTPWGIWNVDHGSPVIIGTAKPYIIGENFFPEAQTGFEFAGSKSFDELTVGYNFTLSNGRGPLEQYADLDSNKGVGGRLWGQYDGDFGKVKLGFSAYHGRYTDTRSKIDLTAAMILPTPFVFESYKETALATDLLYENGPFTFQTEAARQTRVWDEDKRPFDQQGNVQADNRRGGGYVIAAYRLPWLNLRPFVQGEYYNIGTNGGLGGSKDLITAAGGLNIRVRPNVILKATYNRVFFFKPTAGSLAEEPLNIVDAQLSWAF
jgi:hypothetical protein